MLKLKLNSILVKIHKLLPSKVELKLSLGNPFSPGYQLPAKCVHLAQSDFDVSAIIRMKKKLIEIKVSPDVA